MPKILTEESIRYIAKHAGSGMTNEQIAKHLGCSQRTVCDKRSLIKRIGLEAVLASIMHLPSIPSSQDECHDEPSHPFAVVGNPHPVCDTTYCMCNVEGRCAHRRCPKDNPDYVSQSIIADRKQKHWRRIV